MNTRISRSRELKWEETAEQAAFTMPRTIRDRNDLYMMTVIETIDYGCTIRCTYVLWSMQCDPDKDW